MSHSSHTSVLPVVVDMQAGPGSCGEAVLVLNIHSPELSMAQSSASSSFSLFRQE